MKSNQHAIVAAVAAARMSTCHRTMPATDWSKRCSCRDRGFRNANSCACPTCGAIAAETWTLRRHEAMAQYQRLFRLKPVGPHRPMLERVLRQRIRTYTNCGTSGFRARNYAYPCLCDECDALGARWHTAPHVADAARETILAMYPDASAPPTLGAFGRSDSHYTWISRI